MDSREEAEDTRLQAERQYRMVVEAATDAVITIDENSTIVLVNPAVTRIFEEFLQKPFDDEALIGAVRQGISHSQSSKWAAEQRAELLQRYRSLTPRDRQVFALVVRGLLNKQIAGELGTAKRTVKIHRSQVMRKMVAPSLTDLVRMAEELSIDLPEGARRT
jgi:FixJ family two-component response regulator